MALVKHSSRTRRDSGCNCHGDKNVYWAHDTDVTTDRHGYTLKYCPTCEVTGRFVLINANDHTRALKPGSVVSESDRHARNGNVTTEPEVEATDSEVTDTEAEVDMPAAYVAPVDNSRIDALTEIVLDLTSQVGTLTARLNPPKSLPIVHHMALSDVIIDLETREHVLMVGPAGTGKSMIAKQAADVLKLAYYELSLTAGMTATAITGYMTATGEYVGTLFRHAYENGGIFHFDEFDNGHANTIGAVNAALAGDRAAFPDGMVFRHADFVCIASANTFGRGADRQYVGRQQLDAATLDRFVVEEILIDEALEDAVAEAIGYAHTAEVIKYVRKVRANAEANRMPVIVSPRATYGMCKLLKAGKSWDATVSARLRKGMSDSDWSKITLGAYRPASV
jgi:cobaltochelatase CobS